MSSKRRGQLERRSIVLGLLMTLSVIVLIGSVLGLLRTKESYAYRSAETATVRVTGDCETVIMRSSGGGTKCPAAWTVGGDQVLGTLTTYNGGELPADDTIRAKVYGTTARTSLDRGGYLWGLWSPWLALSAGVILASSTVLSRRYRVELRGAVMDVGDVRRLGLTPGLLRDPQEPPQVDDAEVRHLAEDNRLGQVRFVHQQRSGGIVRPVLILAGLLAAAYAFSSLRIIFLVLAVLWIAIAGYGNYLLRTSPEVSAFFAAGLVDRTKEHLFVARYDELEAVWVDTIGEGVHGSRRYHARTRDGRTLVIERDRAMCDELGERMIRDANEARLAQLQHRLSVGAEIGFGPLAATDGGLVTGGGVVPWDAFTDISIDDTELTLRVGEQVQSIPLAEVPWALSLVRIFDARRRTV